MAKQRTLEERERLEKMVRDNPELITSLADPDDFRAIIIGQTYIEAVLTLILEQHFADPATRLPGMSFDTKLALAIAFNDIDPRWVPTLKKLADIRNDFAHKLGHHTLSQDQVKQLRAVKRTMDEQLYVSVHDQMQLELNQVVGLLIETTGGMDETAQEVRETLFLMFVRLLESYDTVRKT